MWHYLLKRLLMMIPTLIGVMTLTFLVTQFVPGGPVDSEEEGGENRALRQLPR